MKGAEEIFINKKSKTGVLMLHGFSSTPAEFRELSVFMADRGFNVLAPLIAGHGTSPEDFMKSSPKDWTKSAMDAYLELKKISEKIFIIGDSFGSNLGFWLIKKTGNEQEGIITLGAPIFLRYQKFLLCRLYTYGLFKKYYHKPPRVYKTDYIDMMDEVTYPVIPSKNLRQFFSFVKNETIPNLNKIKIPALVAHSDSDPVIHPKSATYIYEHLDSSFKKIYWLQSHYHVMTVDEHRLELFKKIFDFIGEVEKYSKH